MSLKALLVKCRWAIMLAIMLSLEIKTVSGQTAFPGAVGFGASATGGRSGTIYHVTNLNDSGTGSFRDAVSQSNRIIVFDVGGYIVATSAISASSNITIFGQTALGGGIGIRARETSFSKSNNIIVRGMRFRQGGEDSATGKSSVGISNGYNMIFDHCSIEFGRWDNFDAVFDSTMTAKGLAENITLQNSIIALPIYQGFGAHIEGGPMTFYRNLWVDEHNRQPLAKNDNIYINNVIYNYDLGYTAGNTGGTFSHDIVNNYFIAGPTTATPADAFFQLGSNQTAYAVGNLLDSNVNGVLDGSDYNTVSNATASTTPWSSLTNSISTLSATDAFSSVVATVGAWPRDTVDLFVVDDVLSLGTSGNQYKGESASAVANYPNSQANTGIDSNGYGALASGTPFTSSASDGIPDYWATANGISTTDADAGTESYGSTGYLNIEAYANSLILPAPWSAADLNSPTTQGASSYNTTTETWLLTGSGVSTGSGLDEGQFASQTWATDGDLVGELTAVSGGSGGLMVRGSTSATAAFAALTVSSTDKAIFQWRPTDGGTASAVQLSSVTAPVYLKLIRQSGTIAGYISTDDTTWKLIGLAQVTLPTEAVAGMVVASGSSALATAQFKTVAFDTDLGSTVKLQASATSLTYPTSLNVTVPVTGTDGAIPTGAVQIWDGSTSITTQALQNGTAYWYVSPSLSAGTHTLTASYAGDTKTSSGFSDPVTITVALAPATLSASCWNASFSYGADYQCTANVSSNAGAPTGMLMHSFDGTNSSSVLSNGSAQWTVSKPNSGTHAMSIWFESQGNFAASSIVGKSFIVTPATVQLQLTPSSYYQSASLTFTLKAVLSSWSAPVPASGTVSFFDNGVALGSGDLASDGSASLTLSSLSAGQHSLTAQYAGSSNYSTATSQTVTVQTF